MKVLYAQFRVYPDNVIHFQIPGEELNRSYGAVVEITEPAIAKYVEEHYDELEKVTSFATDKPYIPCVLSVREDYTYVYLPDTTIFKIQTTKRLKEIEQDPFDYADRLNDALKELLPEKKVTKQEINLGGPEKEAPKEETTQAEGQDEKFEEAPLAIILDEEEGEVEEEPAEAEEVSFAEEELEAVEELPDIELSAEDLEDSLVEEVGPAEEAEEEEIIEGKTPLIWQDTDEALILTWGKFIIRITPNKFEIYLK